MGGGSLLPQASNAAGTGVPTAGLPLGGPTRVHAGKCPFGPALWGGSPSESSHKLAGRADSGASAGKTGLGGCAECP